MAYESLVSELQERGVRMVRYLFIDNDGGVRGILSPIADLASTLTSGLSVTHRMPFTSVCDSIAAESRYGGIGDWRLLPDPKSMRVLPYAPGQAAVIGDFLTRDMQPAPEVCARTQLKSVLSRLQREAGLTARVACENEFYLLKRGENGGWQPIDGPMRFQSARMNPIAGLIGQAIDYLTQQGVELEAYHPEYGPGQHEFVYRHDDALATADKQVIIRETVRAVAAEHGVTATFMPRPLDGVATSGMHINLSLWNDGRNAFVSQSDPLGLSRVARQFIAGLLEHAEAVLAFTSASITSYRRLLPSRMVGAFVGWGVENREVVCRVPSALPGRVDDSLRVEWKASDASGNPYLALAAVVAAGLDGIRRNLDPGEPVTDNPGVLSPAERARRGIRRLPMSLPEALLALERNEWFHELFGAAFIEEYVAMKRHDWQEFLTTVSEWEREKYMRAF